MQAALGRLLRHAAGIPRDRTWRIPFGRAGRGTASVVGRRAAAAALPVRQHEENLMTVRDGQSVVPALLRHFADLRDGTHGDNAVTRQEKDALFTESVALLAPYARQVLTSSTRDCCSAQASWGAPGWSDTPTAGSRSPGPCPGPPSVLS